MIKIYNTMTRRKEEFKPIEKGKVKMYVCGPTVYNRIHLGNARPIIVFDTVRRYLEYKGYEVNYVQNFTDVDDKIINKAKEEGKTAKEISEQFITEYYQDSAALGVKRANIHPKVTENMGDIIGFIEKLVDKQVAYSTEGNVYFQTKKFNGYGKLSKQSINDVEAGARVEIDEKKKNPLDFALWKATKPDEIFWDSPWGKGRPGWHIECSAMVHKFLGETIDIHAGGADLIFPHHENEIAQSESLTSKPFANYWMHNGYININNEKMSKSLGNVFTVRDLLEKSDPLVLRYMILSVHYRNPINFSEELIQQSKNSIERITTGYLNLKYRYEKEKDSDEIEYDLVDSFRQFTERFEQEMNDDFNTANAISVIFDLIKKSNIYLQGEQVKKETLKAFMELLTSWLDILNLSEILEERKENNHVEWIEKLLEERVIAKNDKNWNKADEIRDELNQQGIIIEDTPQGVRWHRK